MEGPIILELAARVRALERIMALILADRAEHSARGQDWLDHRFALMFNQGISEIKATRENAELSTGQKVRAEERLTQVNAAFEEIFDDAAIMLEGLPPIPE